MKAAYTRYDLQFSFPAGTSRGVLTSKETYFIKLWYEENPYIYGIGECAIFRGLSADDCPDYEDKLKEVCENIDKLDSIDLTGWSSIRFGIETALLDLRHGGMRCICPTAFYEGRQSITINGLVWMGDKDTMQQRVEEKLQAGFHCIKLKIGAIDFEAELSLLASVRERFSREEIELRVDANGAFTPENVRQRLDALARYDLHSIEQPLRQGQWDFMSRLCEDTPIPIALDEELIGIDIPEEKIHLLNAIKPQYIVLKPALVGGLSGASAWIEVAAERNIGWWITSALESNIGLNAIAQWASCMPLSMPQGLGTGQLYINNIPSPLYQTGSVVAYNPSKNWDLSALVWK